MFVTSASVSIATTATVPIPQILDVGGGGFNGSRFSHARVVGGVSTGLLTITFDTSALPARVVSGLDDAIIPIPPDAKGLIATSASGGAGVVSFGQSK